MDSLAAIITRDANKLGELERKMAVQSTTVCRLSQLKANDILDQIIKVNADDANESVKKAQSDASSSFWTMLTAIVVGSVTLLVVGVLVAKNIAKALSTLIQEAVRLAKAAVQGNLQTRGNTDLIGHEFRPILLGFNETLDAMLTPFSMTVSCIDRISKGDIPDKITESYNGDFNDLKNNLNQCIVAINGLINEGTNLARAAAEGKLDAKADETKFQGKFRNIIRGMNDTLEGFVMPMQDIGDAMKRMATKDFSKLIDKQYPGTYGQLRDYVNLVTSNIRGAHRADQRDRRPVHRRIADDRRKRQTLAQGAQTQSASVQEMSASTEELARSVGAVKDNANESAKVAEKANHLAEEGGKAVQKSIESMEQIRTSSQTDQRDHPGHLGDRQPNEPSGPERGHRGGPGRRARHGLRRRGRRGAQAGRTLQPGRPRNLLADQGVDAARGRRRTAQRPDGRIAETDHQGVRGDGCEDRRDRRRHCAAGRQRRGSVEGHSRRLGQSPSKLRREASRWPPAASSSEHRPRLSASWWGSSRVEAGNTRKRTWLPHKNEG